MKHIARRVVNLLKGSILETKLRIIRHKFCDAFCKPKNIKYSKSPTAFIFSCPDHGNIGDLAITYSGDELVKKSYDNIVNIYAGRAHEYAKKVKPQDRIFVQGGGNFGGIYPIHDAERLYLLEKFKNNTIVSFPQSIHYTDERYIKMYRRALKKCKDVTLFFRERMSYDRALRDYKDTGAKIILVPDIVFLLKEPIATKRQRAGAVLTLRKDVEKDLPESTVKEIQQILASKKLKYKEKDTIAEKYDSKRKKKIIDDMLSSYRKSQLVITDRLHGMILSYITNTPCIAFSNNNGKVKSTYETWLKDCKYIKFMDKFDASTSSDDIDKMLKLRPKDFNHDLGKEFAPLTKIVEGK